MRTKLLTIAFALTALSGTAAARDAGEVYAQCGIGGALFKDSPILASISNVTFDLGTTAISSNLFTPENCSGGNKKKTAAFIYETQTALEQDIAKGKGQYLTSLYEVSGCAASNKNTQALREGLAATSEGDDRLSRSKAIFTSLADSCTL